MVDHAQAKIDFINAAMRVADLVKITPKLDDIESACLQQLKRAAEEYKKTKQPKRIDEGDEFDSLHGTG
jgi:hypothetical protein